MTAKKCSNCFKLHSLQQEICDKCGSMAFLPVETEVKVEVKKEEKKVEVKKEVVKEKPVEEAKGAPVAEAKSARQQWEEKNK